MEFAPNFLQNSNSQENKTTIMDTGNIRSRLKHLRERRHISQEALAEQLGFKDRQSLSTVELGDRKLTADELLRAANYFGVAIDYFTDPLELAGEGNFSWRQRGAVNAALDSFEIKAGRWIAAYRHLSQLKGTPVNSAMRRVALTAKSSYEDAQAEGEVISKALQLGDVPGSRLVDVLEQALDTLVLHVDTIAGVSGAACQLAQLNCILINRRESEFRRNFDAAHEFFHLLTWAEMPPQRIEVERPNNSRDKRIEQLADNFAGGMLMPKEVVNSILAKNPLPKETNIASWLIPVAAHLQVSRSALMWRLVALRHMSKAAADRICDEVGTPTPQNGPSAGLPPQFSRRFMDTVGWGIDQGHLSARRAAILLDMTLDDLATLFSEHGLKTPFDL